MDEKHQMKFIEHGDFILRLSEVSYFEKDGEKNIIAALDKNSGEKSFVMTFDSDYSRNEAFAKLTIDCEAYHLGYDWEHPLVKQMFFTRDYVRGVRDEIQKFRKEFEILRKQLKMNKDR